MKKFLITGFSGFVSKHFLEYYENNNIHTKILGVDLLEPRFEFSNYRHVLCDFVKMDLLKKENVDEILYEFQPDFILHLASFSSVGYSWKNPVQSFQNNTNIFLNLIETIRHLDLHTRILSIGSSEEYGNVCEQELPLKETHPLDPLSPYAVARVSQEMLSKIYVNGFGLDVVMTRSFNHIGPGQKEVFVASSLARQLVMIKKRDKCGEIHVGDTSIIRDFIDVRDVVTAYDLLFQKGKTGEIYNICSAKGISICELINKMTEILELKIDIKIDKDLIRPNDNKKIVGCNKKIKSLGWDLGYTFEKTLTDLLNYWEKELA